MDGGDGDGDGEDVGLVGSSGDGTGVGVRGSGRAAGGGAEGGKGTSSGDKSDMTDGDCLLVGGGTIGCLTGTGRIGRTYAGGLSMPRSGGSVGTASTGVLTWKGISGRSLGVA